jgi:hypothetical protein
MKNRRPNAKLVSAGLSAAVLAVLLAAGHAAAQSVTPTDTDASSRLNQPLTAATPDQQAQDPNSDSTANDSDTGNTDRNGKPNQDAVTSADPDFDPSADFNAIADAATLKELRRQNMREQKVDDDRPRKVDDGLTPGIRLGSFILRPTVSESVNTERTATGKDSVNRTFLQTGLKGSLTSDWDEHQLDINTQGTWQKTLSGIRQDDPEGSIDAALRLDVTDGTAVNLKAGYSVEREDISAANAISNATNQSLVNTTTATAEIVRNLGLIRGTAGVDFERQTFGNAEVTPGQFVSQADRNQNTVTLRGRIGYEVSAAMIPFIQASYARTIYDEHRDSLGFVRDAQVYELRSGVETDFGDKLRGELAGGYALAQFDDSRLKSISAATLNGNATWSPERGTDINLGLTTLIEPSTTAGASGDVAYTANALITQDIIDTLKGHVSTAFTIRDYSDAAQANQKVYDLGAGLTWGLSRSLDLNADVAWERTVQPGTPTQSQLTAGMGLSLKR